ncbi:hypothetical protein TNCV_1485531 [Trichonephila clavipes]|nr:hypothetical protein TNCV_1485531 [Trichonephila clavipes]
MASLPSISPTSVGVEARSLQNMYPIQMQAMPTSIIRWPTKRIARILRHISLSHQETAGHSRIVLRARKDESY